MTREKAIKLAFHRSSRVERTPLGIREACVEQAALLLEAWWSKRGEDGVASFRWLAKQTLCHVIFWKFSEAFSTDKRRGVPFWSEGALASLQKHGRAATPAWFKDRKLSTSEALVHEHVCERDHLAQWLLDSSFNELCVEGSCSRKQLGATLCRVCVGCVVTEEEHGKLDNAGRTEGDWDNPWHRYRRADLVLVENPKVRDAIPGDFLSDNAILRLHNRLIEEALRSNPSNQVAPPA